MSQLKYLFVQSLWDAEPFFAITSLSVSYLAGHCLVFVFAIVATMGKIVLQFPHDLETLQAQTLVPAHPRLRLILLQQICKIYFAAWIASFAFMGANGFPIVSGVSVLLFPILKHYYSAIFRV